MPGNRAAGPEFPRDRPEQKTTIRSGDAAASTLSVNPDTDRKTLKVARRIISHALGDDHVLTDDLVAAAGLVVEAGGERD